MNQAILVYFGKQNINFLTPKCYPFNFISFQVSAHQNPFFTVSMEMAQKSKILRWSKNLCVNNIQLFWVFGYQMSIFPGQKGP